MFGFGKKKNITCPACGSHNVVKKDPEATESTRVKVFYICNNCGKSFER